MPPGVAQVRSGGSQVAVSLDEGPRAMGSELGRLHPMTTGAVDARRGASITSLERLPTNFRQRSDSVGHFPTKQCNGRRLRPIKNNVIEIRA